MANDYSKLNNLKILVADDEPDLRELIIFDLNEVGVITFEASDYKEALKIFLENNIDFIISDFNMPGSNAVKFIDEIKAHKPNFTNVVFVSGESNLIKRPELEQRGITGFFLKPVSNQIIMDFILTKLI